MIDTTKKQKITKEDIELQLFEDKDLEIAIVSTCLAIKDILIEKGLTTKETINEKINSHYNNLEETLSETSCVYVGELEDEES